MGILSIVGRIKEDIVLGMPFLSNHQCSMTFGVPEISINGKFVNCTDQHGPQLVNDIQVVRPITIGACTEQMVLARVIAPKCFPVGLIESTKPRLLIAVSLNMPNSRVRVWKTMYECGTDPVSPLTRGGNKKVHGH